MVIFQKGARRAPLTRPANESAAAAVALPDGALDVRRDVPLACRGATLAGARLGGGGKLSPLEPVDELIQSAVEHLRDIARRNFVTQQGLRVLELVVRAPSDGELQEETLRRDRRDLRSRGRPYLPRGKLLGRPDMLCRARLNLPRGELPVSQCR